MAAISYTSKPLQKTWHFKAAKITLHIERNIAEMQSQISIFIIPVIFMLHKELYYLFDFCDEEVHCFPDFEIEQRILAKTQTFFLHCYQQVL